MPYAPGVEYTGPQFLFQGMAGLGQGIQKGVLEGFIRADEQQKEMMLLNAAIQQADKTGGIVSQEDLNAFHAGNLAKKREIASKAQGQLMFKLQQEKSAQEAAQTQLYQARAQAALAAVTPEALAGVAAKTKAETLEAQAQVKGTQALLDAGYLPGPNNTWMKMTPTGPEMYRSPADIAKAEKEAIALREAQEREKAGIQVAGGMVFQKPPGGTLQRVIQPPAPEVVAKEQRTVLSQQVKDLRQEFEKAGYPDPNSFLAATVQIPAGAGKTYEEAKEISFKVPVKNRGLVKQILPKADFEKWKQKAAELQGLEQQLSGAREAVLGQAAAPAVTAGITADIVQRGKSTKPEFPVAPSAAAPAVAAVAAAGVAPNREAAQSGQRYIDPEGKIRIKP